MNKKLIYIIFVKCYNNKQGCGYMKRQFYPTIKDFKNMGLTDYQINTLIELENDKHSFHQQFRRISDYSAPNSIFFLDIKDTLYHSSGHGGNGILGRAGDSQPIFMRDILALGSLLEKSTGQGYTMNFYKLCEDESAKIEYDFPIDFETTQYKLDLPSSSGKHPLTWEPLNESKVGPYRTVFISTDSIEQQKNIILFLLLVYKIYLNCASVVYFHQRPAYIDSQEVLKLEELFEKNNCDYDKFILELPQEYSTAFTYYTKKEIEEIMNNITFLSTKGTDLNKADLMKKFLDNYNIKYGLCYDDYNIFACGDSYNNDSPMIKLAFQLGGYGCINNGNLIYSGYGETITNELYKDCGIEINVPITSYSFMDFYYKALDINSLQRTWDLAKTMQDINKRSEEPIINRFKKTNHYIKIKKK